MVVQRNISSPQAKGLVAWYPIIEGSGKSIRDHSGFDNHGVLINMEEADWVGNELRTVGLDFNNGVSDEYITIPDNDALDSVTGETQPRTVTFWMRTTEIDNTVITEKGTNKHLLTQTLNDKFVFGISPQGPNRISSLSDINDDVWHLCGGKFDGTDIFAGVDGFWEASTTPATIPVADNDPLVIGARSGGSFGVPAQIIDVRIYNRDLSDVEFAAMFDPATRWELYQQVRIIPLGPEAIVAAIGDLVRRFTKYIGFNVGKR